MNDDTIQLPAICIRSLNDKLFEKKKIACREIEILTKELHSNGRTNHIKKLIEYLVQNFLESSAPNSKIGGLIAISSVAIALDSDAKLYLDDIVKSIFVCTYDCQRDVRYRSLESLYNVAKCVRSHILIYLDEIFDIIIRLGEDSDQAIKEASYLMDKLIKDIVIENPTFNITSFIGLIRERIYALSQNTRKLILSWISFLDSLPDIDLLIFIEDILDGLLKIACDSNLDIRRTAENILEEFFRKLQSNPEQIEFKPLIKILLIHIQTDSLLVQNISLKWLNQFLKMGNDQDILFNSAHILAVILPCLSNSSRDQNDNNFNNQDNNNTSNNNQYQENFQKKNTELAKSINENLMNLVTKSSITIETETLAPSASSASADNQQQQQNNQIETFESNNNNNNNNDELFKISKILIVLLNELELGSKTSTQTKLAILEWIYQIYENLNLIEIDDYLETKLIEILLQTLCDTSDNVVLLDLKVFCKIIFKQQHSDETNLQQQNYFKLIRPLIDLFYKNPIILRDRGSFIICQLCDTIDAKNVYKTFSEILLEKQSTIQIDQKFICSMVYILNTILLTCKELNSIRMDLKNLNNQSKNQSSSSSSSTSNNKLLFDYLYKTWCYSPVSVISLCFLTKYYQLASELILHFGNININLDHLMEIDQLIQMLESPIFTSLRLDLLNSSKNNNDINNNNYYLRKSLYGLLMLLPQSEAFHLLRKRLQCVPDFPSTIDESKKSKINNTEEEEQQQRQQQMDFKQKLSYYIEIQTSLEANNQSNITTTTTTNTTSSS